MRSSRPYFTPFLEKGLLQSPNNVTLMDAGCHFATLCMHFAIQFLSVAAILSLGTTAPALLLTTYLPAFAGLCASLALLDTCCNTGLITSPLTQSALNSINVVYMLAAAIVIIPAAMLYHQQHPKNQSNASLGSPTTAPTSAQTPPLAQSTPKPDRAPNNPSNSSTTPPPAGASPVATPDPDKPTPQQSQPTTIANTIIAVNVNLNDALKRFSDALTSIIPTAKNAFTSKIEHGIRAKPAASLNPASDGTTPTSLLRFNGFYNDPHHPEGYRKLTIDRDNSFTLEGRDDASDTPIWQATGKVDVDGALLIQQSPAKPGLLQFKALCVDDELLWAKKDSANVVNTWKKSASAPDLSVTNIPAFIRFNGFYSDPNHPEGYRKLTIDRDSSFTLEGRDDASDTPTWQAYGKLVEGKYLLIEQSRAKPELLQFQALCIDDELLWAQKGCDHVANAWKRSSATDMTNTPAFIDFNGFYSDPNHPDGYRKLTINRDCSFTLEGRDGASDTPTWQAFGKLVEGKYLLIEQSRAKPELLQFQALCIEDELLWARKDSDNVANTWKRSATAPDLSTDNTATTTDDSTHTPTAGDEPESSTNSTADLTHAAANRHSATVILPRSYPTDFNFNPFNLDLSVTQMDEIKQLLLEQDEADMHYTCPIAYSLFDTPVVVRTAAGTEFNYDITALTNNELTHANALKTILARPDFSQFAQDISQGIAANPQQQSLIESIIQGTDTNAAINTDELYHAICAIIDPSTVQQAALREILQNLDKYYHQSYSLDTVTAALQDNLGADYPRPRTVFNDEYNPYFFRGSCPLSRGNIENIGINYALIRQFNTMVCKAYIDHHNAFTDILTNDQVATINTLAPSVDENILVDAIGSNVHPPVSAQPSVGTHSPQL